LSSPAKRIERKRFLGRLATRRQEEVPAASRATPYAKHAAACEETGVQRNCGLDRGGEGAIGMGTRERAIIVDDHHPVAGSKARRCPEHGVIVRLPSGLVQSRSTLSSSGEELRTVGQFPPGGQREDSPRPLETFDSTGTPTVGVRQKVQGSR